MSKRKDTRIISFTNQKGGVGKTTTCFNVGVSLSSCGYNVLFIDSDPQGDLTTMSRIREITDNDLTLYDVYHGADINDAIRERGGFSIIVSDENLTRGEIDLVDVSRHVLKDALDRLDRSFDFILIDCPPSLNVLTLDALASSTDIIIPVQSQYLPLKGVARLKETIEKVRSTLNPGLKISGVVLTFYDGRRNLDQQVRKSLESAFGTKVYKTEISNNLKIAESPSHGMSVFEYSPKSKGAEQYRTLSREIIKDMKPHGKREMISHV